MENQLNALRTIGCSPLEAQIYLYLLTRPFERASTIAKHVGVGRTNVYYALEQLENMGLITKIDKPNQVARFAITNPKKSLPQLKVSLEQEKNTQQRALGVLLGELQNQYNYLRGEPNVRFFEGATGIDQVYTDVLREGDNILLFRSHLDNDVPGLRSKVAEQIKQQIQKRIHTRVLAPEYQGGHQRDIATEDKRNLVERRSLSREQFLLPAQIIIYGNKIGLSTFGEFAGTTIVENPLLANTFRVLFELLWGFGKAPYSRPETPTKEES